MRPVDTPGTGGRAGSGVSDPPRGSPSRDPDIRRGGPMTHSIDAPFPPPPTTSGARSGTDTQSTTDTAKDEARNVGQTAAQAGSQVASTAADQAKNVVQETQQQAK